jgi:hypothetical protein
MIRDFLDDYEAKKKTILENEDLSLAGKQKAIMKIERDKKAEARELVRDLRKLAVLNGLALRDAQNERLEKTGLAVGKMDYARLNYEAMAIRSRVEASGSLEDVRELWESAKEKKDVYTLKAWRDTAAGVIASFGGDDLADVKSEILRDIAETETEVFVNAEMSEDEIRSRNELAEIEKDSRAINSVFGNGEAVVNRVFDGIGFENGKVKLGFDYQESVLPYDMGKRKETAQEVFNRVEREYTEKAEDYFTALEAKGLEKLDKDFDDLTGAF